MKNYIVNLWKQATLIQHVILNIQDTAEMLKHIKKIKSVQ